MDKYSLFDLSNRVAIVTGALGTIGRAYARALADYGADIALFDANPNGAEAFLDELRGLGHQAKFYALDVTNIEAIHDTVEIVSRQFGKIDVLINHAGINIRKPAVDFTETEWDKVMGVNLKGMFFMAQSVGRLMVAQRYGKIINTASVSAVRGHAGLAVYAASKGGVVQMTKVLAHEWAPFNVNVNAIGPGYIRTQQTQGYLEQPETYQAIVSKIPMGRVGNPEDLIGGCIFLASKASDYMTGQTLFIEGGRLID